MGGRRRDKRTTVVQLRWREVASREVLDQVRLGQGGTAQATVGYMKDSQKDSYQILQKTVNPELFETEIFSLNFN
jgi:hypothetical protein